MGQGQDKCQSKIRRNHQHARGFPESTSGKEPACQCRRRKRHGFDLWSGRSLGGEHGNPLQYSYLENPMDRGTWRATVHRITKSQTWLKWLSMHEYINLQRPKNHFSQCSKVQSQSKNSPTGPNQPFTKVPQLEALRFYLNSSIFHNSLHPSSP